MKARQRRALLTAAALAAVALTGCTQIVGGTAPMRLTAPVPDFPDVAGLTELDSGSFYIRDGNPEYGFGFVTPNGFVCAMGTYPVWEAARAECTGPRPDQGPGYWTVTAERLRRTIVEKSSMPRPDRNPRDHPTKLLPLRHYVVDSADTVCMVTQDSVVACHVSEHGFILTPTTTRIF